MVVHLNFKSGVPVYLQIVQQVQSSAASGVLRPGDALPSVRVLAEELRINRNTVSRAYAELEKEGVLELRQGSGCFVKVPSASPLKRSARADRLATELDAVIVQAHHLQIEDAALRSLLDERLTDFHQRQRDNG